MTPREQRYLRTGTGLVLVLFIARYASAVVGAERRLRDRVEEKAVEVRRLEADIASLDSLEREAPALRKAIIALAPRLLSGTSDAEALADLSAKLRAIVSNAGAQFERAQGARDSSKAAPLHGVAMEVEFVTDTRGLTEVLAGIGADSEAVGLTRIRISSVNELSSAGAESLRVSLGAAGWYLAGDSVK